MFPKTRNSCPWLPCGFMAWQYGLRMLEIGLGNDGKSLAKLWHRRALEGILQLKFLP